MSKQQIAIFWFRRDLRLEDNAALWMALKCGFPVLPIFIFDKNILDELSDKKDARVLFIHQEVMRLKAELERLGSSLKIFYDTPKNAFAQLIKEYNIHITFTNRDYEPYAQKRDKEIYDFLVAQNIQFKGTKDQVIFEKSEVVKDDDSPYTVFTPYSKKWKNKLNDFYLKSYPSVNYQKNFYRCQPLPNLTLEQIGFQNFSFQFPNRTVELPLIKNYNDTRNLPAIKGTSDLSLHLRFGTISIRQLAQMAVSVVDKNIEHSDQWLNELIWRDFFHMLIYQFPETATQSFKRRYDRIKWRNDKKEFEKWCAGKTGYPIVDAGMRQLNETGFMHNRVRMITASFLVKHLLIDWRWGEKYFAQKLLDYDLAINVGNWQWVAGCGCDAAPYFRIFNPEEQQKRFDPDFIYTKKWVKELNSKDYPQPIVEHKFARQRCFDAFKMVV